MKLRKFSSLVGKSLNLELSWFELVQIADLLTQVDPINAEEPK